MLSERLLLALSALALAVSGGCGEPTSSAPPVRRVILITCDTLRADRVGFGGYRRPTSPKLDALAAESVVFDNAWSAAPLTVPALSALMTGRMPDEIGAGPTNRDMLPAGVLTLAEVARGAGIPTAAFVSNGVLQKPSAAEGDIGLQQGFDVYDDVMNSREINRNLLERTADACTDAVLAWLEQRQEADPFFLWVHYQDPHGPYTPPPEVLARFQRPVIPETKLARSPNNGGKGWIPKYQYIDGLDTPRPYEDCYDAEIAFFDEHVGRLVDELRRRGMLDDSLLVFTADHGEALGEHDYWFCHGEHLFREFVHVPLFVRFPRGKSPPVGGRAPRHVPDLVGHVDIWPTIVEALGVQAPEHRGITLSSAKFPADRVLPQFVGRLKNPKHMLTVTDGRWRALILGNELPALLFDVQEDPGETRDVAAQHTDVVLDLHARYVKFMSSHMGRELEPVRPEMDDATRRGLGGLGYTDGDDH